VFERPLASHRIAGGGLDKNHFRAEVGAEEAAVTTHAPGEIENAQSGKCTRGIQSSRHVETPPLTLTNREASGGYWESIRLGKRPRTNAMSESQAVKGSFCCFRD